MTREVLALALLIGCATQAPVATPSRGEAVTVATGTISAPSPVPVRAHRVPVASRSRRTADPLGTGSLTDTTCYAATGNRTASGLWPRVGMAASNRYPFGTKLLVEGVGVVTVQDRIGAHSSLDLFGPSEAFCREFGRRLLRVWVLR